MNEYYIRQPDSEEARGPYDLGRISDLIEAGKADVTTLYYDEDREDWLPLVDNGDFREILFPEKRRLGLRAREVQDRVNQDDDDEEEKVTVNDMLRHAAGRSEETGMTGEDEGRRASVASLGTLILALSMLISAIYLLYPNSAFVQALIEEGNYVGLALSPVVLVGLLDLFLALCCLLSATEIYGLLRFRVMVGLGYYGYIFWSWQDPAALVASVVAGISMFVLSLTTSVTSGILSMIGSLGGLGVLVYLAFFG